MGTTSSDSSKKLFKVHCDLKQKYDFLPSRTFSLFGNNSPAIVFLGKTGSGKSTLINHILRKNVMQVSNRMVSCTKTITEHFDKESGMLLLDCPGFQDNKGLADSQTCFQLIKFLIKNDCKMINFLYLANSQTRFDSYDIQNLKLLSAFFGPAFSDNFRIVFTKSDCFTSKQTCEIPLILEELKLILIENDISYNGREVLLKDNVMSFIGKLQRKNQEKRFSYRYNYMDDLYTFAKETKLFQFLCYSSRGSTIVDQILREYQRSREKKGTAPEMLIRFVKEFESLEVIIQQFKTILDDYLTEETDKKSLISTLSYFFGTKDKKYPRATRLIWLNIRKDPSLLSRLEEMLKFDLVNLIEEGFIHTPFITRLVNNINLKIDFDSDRAFSPSLDSIRTAILNDGAFKEKILSEMKGLIRGSFLSACFYQ